MLSGLFGLPFFVIEWNPILFLFPKRFETVSRLGMDCLAMFHSPNITREVPTVLGVSYLAFVGELLLGDSHVVRASSKPVLFGPAVGRGYQSVFFVVGVVPWQFAVRVPRAGPHTEVSVVVDALAGIVDFNRLVGDLPVKDVVLFVVFHELVGEE